MAMPGTLTVAERILLHVSQYQKLKESYDVPFDVSQDGIAQALVISRAHAAVELKKLKEAGDMLERLAHIKKGKNKRKVYFLTPAGEEKAVRIRDCALREGIDVGPCVDVRRMRGSDLWNSLSEENRRVLATAVVFRRPFRREALPMTSVALLPVDRDGYVELPEALRMEVLSLLSNEQARVEHSFAADYWLDQGDYRERLYHLLKAGRSRESEMLVANRGGTLLLDADEDLLAIVSELESPSDRYAARVRLVQAECARLAGDREYCLRVCAEMIASQDMRERFEGLLIEGKALRDMGKLEDSLLSLDRAKGLGLHVQGSCVECEIADVMIRSGDYDGALSILHSVARAGGLGDPDNIERAYLLVGTAYLRKGMPSEALRYLSKSLAITKSADKTPWFKALAEAYSQAGMAEKAKEYEAKANPPKKWGSI